MKEDVKKYNNMLANAANPNSNPSSLVLLAESKYDDVRNNVACNTSTPIAILQMLCKDNNKKIRENAQRTLDSKNLDEEYYNYFKNIAFTNDIEKKEYAASLESCSLEAFEVLSNDPSYEVRKIIATNSSCPLYILEYMVNQNDAKISFYVTGVIKEIIEKTKDYEYDLLKRLSKSNSLQLRIDIAKNPNCLDSLLRELSKDKDKLVRQEAILNKNCSVSLLEEISNYEDEIRGFVALNENCTDSILEKLSTDKSAFVRSMVVLNKNCPSYILENLARDEDDSIKISLVKHKNSSDKVYALLSIDKSEDIRNLVIRKVLSNLQFKNCPLDELYILSRSPLAKVRLLVLRQAKCNDEIIKYLARDEDFKVSSLAKKMINKRNIKSKFKLTDYKSEPSSIKQLDDTKQKELDRKLEAEELRNEIMENLIKIKDLSRKLEDSYIMDQYKLLSIPKVRLPDKELLINVDDHLEINPIYLEYLPYIDFTLIKSDKLKVSGIDFRKTNINIDPQKVYRKDLSFSKFNDNNIIFKSFAGCDMRGTDISEEKDSYDLEYAIIDLDTKLPKSKQSIRKI